MDFPNRHRELQLEKEKKNCQVPYTRRSFSGRVANQKKLCTAMYVNSSWRQGAQAEKKVNSCIGCKKKV